jgi:hypothetical protein
MKACTQCGETKEDTEFYREKGRRKSECKACNNKRNRERLRLHPKQRMLATAKWRSKKYGIPFNLTTNDFEIPEVCPLLGIPVNPVASMGKRTDNSPSLDKIDPEKGYTVGNVWVVSDKANRMKQNMTVELLRHFADTIEKQLEG